MSQLEMFSSPVRKESGSRIRYPIVKDDGTKEEVEGLLVRGGLFRRPVVAIRGEVSVYAVKSYVIDHIPTGGYVWKTILYAGVARVLAAELLEHSTMDLQSTLMETAANGISLEFREYLRCVFHLKSAPTFLEWREELRRTVAIEQERQRSRLLLESASLLDRLSRGGLGEGPVCGNPACESVHATLADPEKLVAQHNRTHYANRKEVS